MTREAWQQVHVDELQVGQFVRLGHRWFEHPFLLNRFRIASEREIAIIRDAGLTRIFIDPARCGDESSAAPADATGVADAGVQTVQLQSRKAVLAERVRRQHAALTQVGDDYAAAVVQCRGMFGQIGAGDAAAVATAGALTRSLVDLVTDNGNPLSFAATSKPADAAALRACNALDAAAIAAAVGRRLGLRAHGLETLTTAALVHAIGIEEMPASLQDEAAITGHGEMLDFQQYPLLGAEALRGCGRFSSEVLQIVRQHRERLDGSGFPEGTAGDHIHAYARVIGAIHEFLLLAGRDRSKMPAAALSHLYRRLRSAYGPVAVDNVIAALTIYPPGSFIALSDGSIGRVVQVSDHARLRPTVCLFDDAVVLAEAQIVDLSDTATLSVARVLDPDQLDDEVREFFGGGWSGFAFSRRAAESGAG